VFVVDCLVTLGSVKRGFLGSVRILVEKHNHTTFQP
jgi:hypothetical protein